MPLLRVGIPWMVGRGELDLRLVPAPAPLRELPDDPRLKPRLPERLELPGLDFTLGRPWVMPDFEPDRVPCRVGIP